MASSKEPIFPNFASMFKSAMDEIEQDEKAKQKKKKTKTTARTTKNNKKKKEEEENEEEKTPEMLLSSNGNGDDDGSDPLSEEMLDEIIRDNSHFPTPQVTDFLKVKCQRQLDRGDVRGAAVTLLHSQAFAFRHQVITQYSKRLRKREEDEQLQQAKSSNNNNKSPNLILDEEEEDADLEARADGVQKRSLAFQSMASSSPELERMVAELPDDWRIVHLAVQSLDIVRFKKTKSDDAITMANLPLIVSAFSCGGSDDNDVVPLDCCVRRVPALRNDGRPTILKEFQDIITSHRQIYQKTTEEFVQSAYMKARDDLDDRMRSLLDTVGDKWLGEAKVLLLGKPRSTERVKLVREAAEAIAKRMKMSPEVAGLAMFTLLDGASLLNAEQLAEACVQVAGSDCKKTSLKTMAKSVREFGEANPCGDVDRCPVVLILDREIQGLPWESLSYLRGQPCSRVPSVFFLSALFETHEMNKRSVARMGVSSQNIFYVLNPNKDLDKTQRRLEVPFRQFGDGVVGQWPSFPQLQEALSTMDAFMYCGHGSRLKTMTSQEIEKLRVRAVPLLFGCNSGRLDRIGRTFDPVGAASSYLLATSPCLLGFLWSVTDRDVDEWTIDFLEHWLGGGEKGPPPKERDFVRAVSQKRFDFARLLNSAATVVYGLPSFLDREKV